MTPMGLQIVLQAPTLVAMTPPASNLTETLSFIPGNTVRGVLARRYLDQHGAADDQFQRLFVTGAGRFGCAWVAGAYPIPLSARSCKYDGGFRADGDHGVTDLLLAGPGERACEHEKCGRPLDYFQGFWHLAPSRQASVHTRLITRTAIDPGRATARTGQLFSQRVLEEGQVFLGRLEVPDALSRDMATLLHKPFTARLGTGTSRGQGWVEVSGAVLPPTPWGTAAARFQRFAQREGKPLLVVTLLSEGLFQDEYLRDTTAPSSADLQPLGIVSAQWQPYHTQAFMSTRVVFGFDGEPVRLPRQPRLAVEAGSVFLFEARDPQAQPTLPAGDGLGWIGASNREGFGRAILWSPFHLDPDPPEEA